MTRLSGLRLVVVYATLSAVYLLYLPHAMPIMDDWTLLEFFATAKAGGLHGIAGFLQGLIQNHHPHHFRLNWAGYFPAFVLYFAAGLTPWPYALLAWAAHLGAAYFLSRLVASLISREGAGLLAGAFYAVLPSCNNILFLFVSSSYYYFQTLALVWWLHRLASRERDPGWRDLALLPLVVFTGEQIQAALLLLPLLMQPLFGRGPSPRGWLRHTLVIGLLIGVYYFAINCYPVTRGLDRQTPWSLRPVSFHLFGSLGLEPAFAQWRPAWQPGAAVLGVAALAAAAFLLAWPRAVRADSGPNRSGELLVFSVAGVILAYLPAAWLATFEWRYLYVPSLFLAAGGAAVLNLLPRRVAAALAGLAIVYSSVYTYYEMHQCWIPQSRAARAQLAAVAANRPYRPGEIVVLAGSHLRRGTAPDFIAGTSWSLRSVLALAGGAQQVQAGREIVAGDHGELFLFQGDAYVPIRPEDLARVRYIGPNAGGRLSVQPLPPPRRVSSHVISLRLRHIP